MNSPILHYLIPLVVILIINHLARNKIDKRLILLLSPLALIPDIDYLIFYHRATFHTIFFGIFIVSMAVITLKKYFKPWKTAAAGSFFFLMHLVLDRGEVIWFYPFTNIGYSFVGHRITLEGLQIVPHFPLKWWLINASGVLLLFALFLIELIIEHKYKGKPLINPLKKK